MRFCFSWGDFSVLLFYYCPTIILKTFASNLHSPPQSTTSEVWYCTVVVVILKLSWSDRGFGSQLLVIPKPR